MVVTVEFIGNDSDQTILFIIAVKAFDNELKKIPDIEFNSIDSIEFNNYLRKALLDISF